VAPAGFTKLYNGKGTADKKSQASPFSLINLGMFGLGVLCVSGLAFGVRSMKKRSTRTFFSLVASDDPESGLLELLSEDPLE